MCDRLPPDGGRVRVTTCRRNAQDCPGMVSGVLDRIIFGQLYVQAWCSYTRHHCYYQRNYVETLHMIGNYVLYYVLSRCHSNQFLCQPVPGTGWQRN